MLVKTAATTHPNSAGVVPIKGHVRQLENLYARRSAVEALIQSLEDYQRFRAHCLELRKSKSA